MNLWSCQKRLRVRLFDLMHVDLTELVLPVDFGGRDARDGDDAPDRAADAAFSPTRARASALSQTRARAAASVNKMSGELADPLKRWPQIEQETWLQRQLLAEDAHHMDGAWASAPSEATILEHVLALQEQMRELQKQLPRKPERAPEIRGHLDPQTPALPVALLRQLKVLLDDGSITPEQFEIKREELLARSTGAAEDRARNKRLSSSHAENVQSTYSIAIGALSSNGCPLVLRVTTLAQLVLATLAQLVLGFGFADLAGQIALERAVPGAAAAVSVYEGLLVRVTNALITSPSSQYIPSTTDPILRALCSLACIFLFALILHRSTRVLLVAVHPLELLGCHLPWTSSTLAERGGFALAALVLLGAWTVRAFLVPIQLSLACALLLSSPSADAISITLTVVAASFVLEADTYCFRAFVHETPRRAFERSPGLAAALFGARTPRALTFASLLVTLVDLGIAILPYVMTFSGRGEDDFHRFFGNSALSRGSVFGLVYAYFAAFTAPSKGSLVTQFVGVSTSEAAHAWTWSRRTVGHVACVLVMICTMVAAVSLAIHVQRELDEAIGSVPTRGRAKNATS